MRVVNVTDDTTGFIHFILSRSGVGTAFDQWSWAYDGSNAYVPEHTHEGKEIRRYLQRGRT